MNRTLNDLTDEEYERAVLDDCFQRDPGQGWWDDLRSDDNVAEFLAALKQLAADLHNQLATYKESLATGKRAKDADWHTRTKRLKRVVEVRLIEIKQLVKTKNIRISEEQRGDGSTAKKSKDEIFTQLRALRFAVHTHRERAKAEDYDPTDFDLALWAAVEGKEVVSHE